MTNKKQPKLVKSKSKSNYISKASYIPLLFILLVGGFMVLDGLFIYLAERSYSGPVTEKAYQKGIDVLKGNNGADNFKTIIDYSDGILKVRISCKDNCNSIDKIEAKIVRPTTNKYDKHLDLEKIQPDLYHGYLNSLDPGQWEVRLKIICTDRVMYAYKRFFNA